MLAAPTSSASTMGGGPEARPQVEPARRGEGIHLIVPAGAFRAGMPAAAAYARTAWVEVSIGFAVGSDGEEMPYSTSVPMIRCILTTLTGAQSLLLMSALTLPAPG